MCLRGCGFLNLLVLKLGYGPHCVFSSGKLVRLHVPRCRIHCRGLSTSSKIPLMSQRSSGEGDKSRRMGGARSEHLTDNWRGIPCVNFSNTNWHAPWTSPSSISTCSVRLRWYIRINHFSRDLWHITNIMSMTKSPIIPYFPLSARLNYSTCSFFSPIFCRCELGWYDYAEEVTIRRYFGDRWFLP